MQASEVPRALGNVHGLYHQPEQYYNSFHVLNNYISNDQCNSGTSGSIRTHNEHFFTLDSTPTIDYVNRGSPSAVSISSNQSPFSPQSDLHHSSDNTCRSPLSGSSGFDDGNELRHALREMENKLLGPEPKDDDISSYVESKSSSFMLQIAPSMDLKELLFACAETVSDADISRAEALINLLEQRVSVSGDPIQRLSAYMLEGLRARVLASGSIIYKKLKCREPTGSELLSYMQVLYHICPYYKFGYISANTIIQEAMMNEKRIHIIDFQIAQGSQWMFFIQAVANRPGGSPFIYITGIDDSQSAQGRGGGLHLVGERLAKVAKSCGVAFEFHAAAISGCEVEVEDLKVDRGVALAVNFPYMLHHTPDESVSTENHRDRLLRLVKSLSPRVVTLVEQESNTNTAPFLPRFRETFDYYTAMFESIDAARPREDRQRLSAEEHCVARDIVNIIACEGGDRVERHELFGKWKLRFVMAGFSPCHLSPSVGLTVTGMLKDYSPNYKLAESDGALYLGWKNRALVTCSAWR